MAEVRLLEPIGALRGDLRKKGELYDVYIKDGLAYISPCHSVCVMDEEMFMKHFEPFYKSPANPFHPEKKNHADK